MKLICKILEFLTIRFCRQSSKNDRILIVDDNPINNKILKSFLEANTHCTVDIATTGQDAINLFKMARKHGIEYKMVVIDYMLPQITGEYVSAVIKSICPEVKTVLLTAHEDIMFNYFKSYKLDAILYKSGGINVLKEIANLFYCKSCLKT